MLLTSGKFDEISLAMYDSDWFGYANSILSYLSGLALVIVLLLTMITMTMDLIYLQLPTAKQLFDSFIENKKGNALARGAVRLLVSKTAIQSFDESAQTGTPVMWVYMKNSLKHFIFTCIMVVILATGLDTILGLVYNLIRGFLQLIPAA